MTSTLVRKIGMPLEDGFIYYVDTKDGNIYRTKVLYEIGASKKKGSKPELMSKVHVAMKPDSAYFVDHKGDIRRVSLKKVELKSNEKLPAKSVKKTKKK